MLGKVPKKILPNGDFSWWFTSQVDPVKTGILDLLVGWLENVQNILPDGGVFIGDESHSTK